MVQIFIGILMCVIPVQLLLVARSDTLEDEITEKFECSPLLCHNRGECKIDDNMQMMCECYSQYYYGEICENVQYYCDRPLYECTHSRKCVPTFGNYFCVCDDQWSGMKCNLLTDYFGELNKKTILESNLFLPLNPMHFSEGTIYLAATSFADQDEAVGTLIIEGSTYLVKGTDFKQENVKSEVTKLFPYLTGDEPMSQVFATKISHQYLQPGENRLVFQNVLRYAHYTYKVQKKGSTCRPYVVVFGGGAASETQTRPAKLHRTFSKYQMLTYIIPGCSETNSFIEHKLYIVEVEEDRLIYSLAEMKDNKTVLMEEAALTSAKTTIDVQKITQLLPHTEDLRKESIFDTSIYQIMEVIKEKEKEPKTTEDDDDSTGYGLTWIGMSVNDLHYAVISGGYIQIYYCSKIPLHSTSYLTYQTCEFQFENMWYPIRYKGNAHGEHNVLQALDDDYPANEYLLAWPDCTQLNQSTQTRVGYSWSCTFIYSCGKFTNVNERDPDDPAHVFIQYESSSFDVIEDCCGVPKEYIKFDAYNYDLNDKGRNDIFTVVPFQRHGDYPPDFFFVVLNIKLITFAKQIDQNALDNCTTNHTTWARDEFLTAIQLVSTRDINGTVYLGTIECNRNCAWGQYFPAYSDYNDFIQLEFKPTTQPYNFIESKLRPESKMPPMDDTHNYKVETILSHLHWFRSGEDGINEELQETTYNLQSGNIGVRIYQKWTKASNSIFTTGVPPRNLLFARLYNMPISTHDSFDISVGRGFSRVLTPFVSSVFKLRLFLPTRYRLIPSRRKYKGISTRMDYGKDTEGCQLESGIPHVGRPFSTNFRLCYGEENDIASQPLSYMFYQQTNEIGTENGICIGYGNSLALSYVILASSGSYSKNRFKITHNLLNAEYFADEQPGFGIKVLPPYFRSYAPMSHVEEIKNTLEGKHKFDVKHPSITFDAKHGQHIQLVQKINALLIETLHVGESKTIDESVYIMKTKDEIVTNMTGSLLTALASVENYPEMEAITLAVFECLHYRSIIPSGIIKTAASIVKQISDKLKNYVPGSALEKKPKHLADFANYMLPIFSILLRPHEVNQTGLQSSESGYVQFTKNFGEILISDELYLTEDQNYPLYDLESEELDVKLKAYEDAIDDVIDAAKSLLEAVALTFERIEVKTPKPTQVVAVYDVTLGKMLRNKKVLFGEVTILPNYVTSYKYINDWCSLVIPKDPSEELTEEESGAFTLQYLFMPGIQYYTSLSSEHIIKHSLLLQQKDVPKKNLRHVRQAPPATNPKVYIEYGLQGIDLYPVYGRAVAVDDNDFLITYSAKLLSHQSNRYLVSFDPNYLFSDLKVVILLGNAITLDDFQSKAIIFNATNNHAVLLLDFKKGSEFLLMVAIQPLSRRAATFKMTVLSIECVSWNSNEKAWVPSGSLEYIHDRANPSVKCIKEITTEGDLFSLNTIAVKFTLNGLLKIQLDYIMATSILIPICVAIISALCIVLLVIANVFDRKDEGEIHPVYILSNREEDYYKYVVVVVTGSESWAGTTSHVGIKIYGTLHNSKRHVLFGFADKKFFCKRQVDWFIVTTKFNLGQIRAVQLWIDYRGYSPTWYCEKVIVRDYNISTEWVFMVQKWFCVDSDKNCSLSHVLYQKILKPPRLCSFVRIEDFYNYHIWFGMFVREPCNSFSRKLKVMSVFCMISVAMFIVLLRQGVPSLNRYASSDVGHIQFDKAILLGFISLLIAMVVIQPIIFLTRNSNPKRESSYYLSDFSGIDPTAPIPMYLLSNVSYVFGWICLILILSSSLLMAFVFGFEFGQRKSVMWFIALITIIILDAVILETLIVLIRSFVWKIVMKKKDTQRFCNNIVDLCIDRQKLYANSRNMKAFLKRDMFQPVPRKIRKVLAKKEAAFARIHTSYIDLILYTFIVIFLILLLQNHEGLYPYQAVKVIDDMILGRYTATSSFMDIHSWLQFIDYLNYSLLQVIHSQGDGYLVASNWKLLGVVRLRQHRINQKYKCFPEENFIRNDIKYCSKDINNLNMEKNNFSPKWVQLNNSYTHTLQKIQIQPFLYQESNDHTETNIYAENIIPTGGYIANLGRTAKNTEDILNYICRINNWIDSSTRVVVIEFVVKNIHCNLFIRVKLVAESFVSGDFTLLKKIDPVKLYDRTDSDVVIRHIVTIVTTLIVIIYVIRLFIGFIRQPIMQFVSNICNYIDITTIIACILLLYFTFDYELETNKFLEKMIHSKRNVYHSLDIPIRSKYLLNVCIGYVIFICLLKMTRVFHFIPVVRCLQYTLENCYQSSFTIIVFLLFIVLAVSGVIYLQIGTVLYILNKLSHIIIMMFAYPLGLFAIFDAQLYKFNSGILNAMIIVMFIIYKMIIIRYLCVIIIWAYNRAKEQINRESLNEFTVGLYIRERILRRSIILDADRLLPKRCSCKQ